MRSKELFDPELLEAFQGNPPILNVNSANLNETRAFTIEMMSSFPPELRESIKVDRRVAAFNGHSVPVIVYRPGGGASLKPGVIHLHAGGFILGNAEMCENYCAQMAVDFDSVIVSVDYRLAPEHPFPAALQDGYTALMWMSEVRDLEIDRGRLAITGESGGGGLAAQLSFLVRDRKEVEVNFVFLAYPMLDNRTARSQEPGEYMGQYFWTRESNAFAWQKYLGEGLDNPPYPSVPACINKLQGLPPTYIAVGTLDLFATECLNYALRLTQHGVSTEIHLYPGACHGFDYAVETFLSRKFFEERRSAFRARLKNG